MSSALQSVIKVINTLKSKSKIPLLDNQLAYIPCKEDIIEEQITKYTYSYTVYDDAGNKGYKIERKAINPNFQVMFRLNKIFTNQMDARTYIDWNYTTFTLPELVEMSIIKPMMVFINGKFVPWSMISIVASVEDYYMIISANRTEWIEEIRNIESIDTYILPNAFRYGDITLTPGLMFNVGFTTLGAAVMENAEVGFQVKEGKTAFNRIFMNVGSTVNSLLAMYDRNNKITDKNIMIFEDGKLCTTTPVLVEGGMLTLNEAQPLVKETIIYIFSNSKAAESVENIADVNINYIQPIYQTKNTTNPEDFTLTWPSNLAEEFIMAMSRKKSYDENLKDVISIILAYNPYLFEQAYLDNTNLSIEERTGEWLNSNAVNGLIKIPREHSSTIDEFILIFINGLLYPFMQMGKYIGSNLQLPVQGVNDWDKVEVFRFKNANNSTSEIVIYEDDGYKEYSDTFINNAMNLWSNETQDDYFIYPFYGLQRFKVGYTLDTNDEGKIKITLDNPFYYGKTLTVASQYRYKEGTYYFSSVVASSDGGEQYDYRVDLRDTFMYCDDPQRYLLFYNGRRLSTEQFRLVLPCKSTVPFTSYMVYLAVPFKDGDRLQIIYTPSLLTDVAMQSDLDLSGVIVIDKSKINYALSANTYMVWVNGKKVPMSSISNIDSNRIRVITNQFSTKTVAITKYIPDIDELTETFNNTLSMWDKIIDEVSREVVDSDPTDPDMTKVYDFLNQRGETLTNTEDDFYANTVSIRAIMNELIREQYLQTNQIDITGPFVYDYYDTSIIDDTDSDGNGILPVADSNRPENLDDVTRPWP